MNVQPVENRPGTVLREMHGTGLAGAVLTKDLYIEKGIG